MRATIHRRHREGFSGAAAGDPAGARIGDAGDPERAPRRHRSHRADEAGAQDAGARAADVRGDSRRVPARGSEGGRARDGLRRADAPAARAGAGRRSGVGVPVAGVFRAGGAVARQGDPVEGRSARRVVAALSGGLRPGERGRHARVVGAGASGGEGSDRSAAAEVDRRSATASASCSICPTRRGPMRMCPRRCA